MGDPSLWQDQLRRFCRVTQCTVITWLCPYAGDFVLSCAGLQLPGCVVAMFAPASGSTASVVSFLLGHQNNEHEASVVHSNYFFNSTF